MSSNLSLSLTRAQLEALVPKFCVYVVQGLFLATVNFIIFVAIVRHKIIREKKQYVFVATLSLVDGLNGLATFLAGSGRTYLIMTGAGGVLVSRWQCLLTPWCTIFIWTDILQTLILLIISIDRIIAIGFPLQYYGYTTRYAHRFCGSAFGAVGLIVMAGYVTAYQYQHPERPAICFTGYGHAPDFYTFHNYCRVIPALLSILLYCVAVSLLKKNNSEPTGLGSVSTKKTAFGRSNAVTPSAPKRQSTQRRSTHQYNQYMNEMQSQKRLTVTLGISGIFTFIFYIVPMLVEIFALFLDNGAAIVAVIVPYTFILNNINPMLNLWLYTMKHKDLKLAVKFLFTCQRLTPVILEQHGQIILNVRNVDAKSLRNGPPTRRNTLNVRQNEVIIV